MSKYGNYKTRTSDGIVHDSQAEAMRWAQLCLMNRAGSIKDLRRQVDYELLPAQRERSTEVYRAGPRKGQPKPGKVIEKRVVYRADFVYTDTTTGETVVEDVKGMKTKDYIIKRKLMLYFHGIRIVEVKV
jgi:hypothetical protein